MRFWPNFFGNPISKNGRIFENTEHRENPKVPTDSSFENTPGKIKFEP